MGIAIVTDSTSDLPPELLRRQAIHQIPAVVVMGTLELEDGPGISREDFYRRLPEMKTPPTTAAPSSGAFEALYNQLFQQGADHIVSIHAGSALSAIYSAARIAAQAFGDRVRVFDSGQVSMGLGFQVLAAAEAAASAVPLQAVLDHLEDVRRRIRLVAMLDTLEYLKRSGRVSWARAGLGSLLRIRPFVELRESVVYRVGETRTRRQGIVRLIDLIHSQEPLERLAMLHTNAEEQARQLYAQLDLQLSHPVLFINVTTVIGSHVGPNALGFALVLQSA